MEKLENGESEERSKSSQWELAILKNWKWISLLIIMTFVIVSIVLIGLGIYFLTLMFMQKETRGIRLPKTIVPYNYKLEIQPYLAPHDLVFNGNVEIKFVCQNKTDTIILHSKNLTIDANSVKIRSEKGNDVEIIKVDYDEGVDFVIFNLMDDLTIGKYTLFITFKGVLQDSLHGFYYYSYENEEDNSTNYVALTQFEAIHAREAFPCFDEPALKATFDITIVRWRNMTALSNMPKIRSETRGNVWIADIFETSMKMSTYLVAFVIGNFTNIHEGKISFWASPETVSKGNYALEVANKILPFYETLLGVEYRPPKLDMVSLKEFSAGGMENWGLITYAERGILFDEKKDNEYSKDDLVQLVAHEIAHQWFGNLVTMKWWNDLWLNEGITTFMEYVAWENNFPAWNKIDSTLYYHERMLYSFNNSVTKKVENRDDVFDIDRIFDSATYGKGSFVIRMALNLLGNETFWKGINKYLIANSYSNTEEGILWKYLTEAQEGYKTSKLNLTEIMTPWTHSISFPVITVTRDYKKHTALLTQNSASEGKDNLWPIPIYYATADNQNWNAGIKMWMKTRNATIRNILKNNGWFYLDGTKVGLMYVNYDRENWRLLAMQLKKNHRIFPITQRYKLLEDAHELETLNLTTCDVVLDLYLYLPYEELSFLSSNILSLMYKTYFTVPVDMDEYLKRFFKYLTIPLYNKLNLEDNDEYEIGYKRISYAESELMRFTCNLGYPKCINEAVRKYEIWKNRRENQTKISPYISSNVLCNGIREGNKDDWDYLYNIYLEDKDSDKIDALLCSKDKDLREKIMKLIIDDENLTYFHLIKNKENWPDLLHIFDKYIVNMTETIMFERTLMFVRHLLMMIPSDHGKQVILILEKHLKEIDESQAKILTEMIEESKKKDVDEFNYYKECVVNWLKAEKWTD